MPHRRLTTVALTLLAPLAVAGCSVELPAGAIPPPISIAPAPSGSAGVPKYVCSATYKILTEGALRLAEQATGSGDDAKAAMKQTFTDMAAKVDVEKSRATDPELQTALQAISDDLTAGAQQADPKTYINGDFQTVGQKLDGHCD